jgi:hypothetical protein
MISKSGGMDQQVLRDKRQYDLASIDRCNSIRSQAELFDDLRAHTVLDLAVSTDSTASTNFAV